MVSACRSRIGTHELVFDIPYYRIVRRERARAIADDDAHLNVIFDLDNATNDRLLAENNLLPGRRRCISRG